MGKYKDLMTEDIFMRSDMPQIKTGDLQKAFKKLNDIGVKVKKGRGWVDDWKPSQKDIYKDKVRKILKDPRTKNPEKMKPFVISRDNYLVDGHHRWAAMKVAHPNHKFPYFKIDLPIEQAVKIYNKISEMI